ncbi:MAG: NAD-dependent epimerase/dehydratase family protein [Caldilinea sp.]
MRVLVTGAGGFVGSHLVESQLAHGNIVRAVDLNLSALVYAASDRNVELIVGDLTDEGLSSQLMAGIDVVYHLASAHLDVSRTDGYYHLVNVTATQTLLQAACAAGVQRFVHCSTNGVLGDISRIPADETTPCHPTNIYEQTKLLGEQAALDFFRETGLPVVVARPAWVYGPRCPRTARLLRTVRKGRFVMFGSGETLRHPIYVSDAVRGLELCAERGVPGEIYFLAGDRTVTLNELVQTIADVQGVPRPCVRLPMPLGFAAAYGIQLLFGLVGRRPPISRRTLDFYLKNNAYDIAKARRELGFAPDTKLSTGLQQTLQ